jgi:hypothetical protein
MVFRRKRLTEQKFDIDRRFKTAATRVIGITFVTVTGVPSALALSKRRCNWPVLKSLPSKG